jgi:hypothetical protein
MEEKTFRNLQAVAVYLRGQGWKVSKSTVYGHHRARKIKAREDGLFYLADVETYAGDYLKHKNEPQAQTSDAIQRRRNEAEARKMEAQAKHWEIKSQVAAGALVERGAFERALVNRAMILKNDLVSFAHANAPEVCRLVGGDQKLIPELTEFILEHFAIFLNRYAGDKEFIVPAPMTDTLEYLDRNDDEENENAEYLENDTDG